MTKKIQAAATIHKHSNRNNPDSQI